MNISWNTVTWYSKLLAAILYIIVFSLGGYIGTQTQKAQDNKIIAERDGTITSLKLQIATKEVVTSQQNSFNFSGPTAGTSLCRGKIIPLNWTVGNPVQSVSIVLLTPTTAGVIGEFPASWNETGTKDQGTIQWEVGTIYSFASNKYNMPDGPLYTISARAKDAEGKQISEQKIGPFSIQTCQG